MKTEIKNTYPLIKFFANGFQITFDNRYTIVAKNNIGTKSTQSDTNTADLVEVVLTSRYGGSMSPDLEVTIYDPANINISHKFGEEDAIGFVAPGKFADLMYIVSRLGSY